MRRQWLTASLAVQLALLPGSARADVLVQGYRRLAVEYVFTGIQNFPTIRFHVAPWYERRDVPGGDPISCEQDAATEVSEGQPLPIPSSCFQRLYAVRADASRPGLTAPVLLEQGAITSAILMARPPATASDSTEAKVRFRWRVRELHPSHLVVEPLDTTLVHRDGHEEPHARALPAPVFLQTSELPAGWQIHLLPHSSPDTTAGQVYRSGQELSLPSGSLWSLVASRGAAPTDERVVLVEKLDGWSRALVPVNGPITASRFVLEVAPREGRLRAVRSQQYRDKAGDWFHDEGLESPVSERSFSWLWALAAVGVLLAGVLAVALVRRTRRARTV